MIVEMDLTGEEKKAIEYVYDTNFNDVKYNTNFVDNMSVKEDILKAINFAYINLKWIKLSNIDLSHTGRLERKIDQLQKNYSELQQYSSEPFPPLDQLPQQPNITFELLKNYLFNIHKIPHNISEDIYKSIYYEVFGIELQRVPKYKTKPLKAVQNLLNHFMETTAVMMRFVQEHGAKYKKK